MFSRHATGSRQITGENLILMNVGIHTSGVQYKGVFKQGKN